MPHTKDIVITNSPKTVRESYLHAGTRFKSMCARMKMKIDIICYKVASTYSKTSVNTTTFQFGKMTKISHFLTFFRNNPAHDFFFSKTHFACKVASCNSKTFGLFNFFKFKKSIEISHFLTFFRNSPVHDFFFRKHTLHAKLRHVILRLLVYSTFSNS